MSVNESVNYVRVFINVMKKKVFHYIGLESEQTLSGRAT